jgi:hypothetical protein
MAMKLGSPGLCRFLRGPIVATAAMLLASTPSAADWTSAVKAAAIKYGDEKKNEVIKEKSEEAVKALYAKLYKSGADRTLLRVYADVAVSTPELEKLAEEFAKASSSNDAEEMRQATEKVELTLGKEIARMAPNKQLRDKLSAVIGKGDTIDAIVNAFGNAASGTEEGRRESAEYIGETLLAATPGADVVAFSQSAYGAMKFVKDRYVESNLEELYQHYKSMRGGAGDNDAAQAQGYVDKTLDQYVYAAIVRDQMAELRQEKTKAIADALGLVDDKLRDHLTGVSDQEIKDSIIASFKGRFDKERNDAEVAQKRATAQDQAEEILKELNSVGDDRYPPVDKRSVWFDKAPIDLDKFPSMVRDRIIEDEVLDPDNLDDLKAMARALATGLLYNPQSPQYAEQLKLIKDREDSLLKTMRGAPCLRDTDVQRLADRLWQKGDRLVAAGKADAGRDAFTLSLSYCPDANRSAWLAGLAKSAASSGQPPSPDTAAIVARTHARLLALNYAKLKALLDYMNITAPREFYACMCSQIPHGPGVGFAYDPEGCKAKWGDKVCHFVGGWGDSCADTPTGEAAWTACLAVAGIGYKSPSDRGTPIDRFVADYVIQKAAQAKH